MQEEWIKAFAKLTYGIYVLTSKTDEAVNAMIAAGAFADEKPFTTMEYDGVYLGKA